MTPVRHIAIENRAGAALDLELALAVEALRAELPRFCAAWSLPTPGVAYYGASGPPLLAAHAVIIVVASTGDPSAFARHSELGAAVYGYVDATVCRAGGEPIPRALSHECFEMVADPGLDQVEPQPDGSAVAREVSDPVNRQGLTVEAEFMGSLGLVSLSNYVLPAWYVPNSPGPYDRCGVLEAPLEDGAFGHHQVIRNGVAVLSGTRASVSSFGRTFRRMMKAAGPRIG